MIFFFKRKIFHIIAIPYREEWNKGSGVGPSAERSSGPPAVLGCGGARSSSGLHIPSDGEWPIWDFSSRELDRMHSVEACCLVNTGGQCEEDGSISQASHRKPGLRASNSPCCSVPLRAQLIEGIRVCAGMLKTQILADEQGEPPEVTGLAVLTRTDNETAAPSRNCSMFTAEHKYCM